MPIQISSILNRGKSDMRLTCELIISCVYLLALLIKRIEWVLRQDRRFIASSAPPVLLHIVSNGSQLFLKRERVRRTHTDKWSGVTLVEFWIAGYKKYFWRTIKISENPLQFAELSSEGLAWT